MESSGLNLAREWVTKQCLSADSLPEMKAAKQVLREWMQAHPEEQGMREQSSAYLFGLLTATTRQVRQTCCQGSIYPASRW